MGLTFPIPQVPRYWDGVIWDDLVTLTFTHCRLAPSHKLDVKSTKTNDPQAFVLSGYFGKHADLPALCDYNLLLKSHTTSRLVHGTIHVTESSPLSIDYPGPIRIGTIRFLATGPFTAGAELANLTSPPAAR